MERKTEKGCAMIRVMKNITLILFHRELRPMKQKKLVGERVKERKLIYETIKRKTRLVFLLDGLCL